MIKVEEKRLMLKAKRPDRGTKYQIFCKSVKEEIAASRIDQELRYARQYDEC